MKKTLCALLLVLSLTATACSNKWDQSDPTMSADLIEHNQEILDAQLAILETAPEDGDALFEVALRYQELGNWKKAVEYYEKVLTQDEYNFPALNNMAYMYEKMEDYATAAEYIKKLYSVNQANVEVIRDTVRILLEADDAVHAQEALDNFEKLSLDPSTPDAGMQALIEELQGDIDAKE